MIEFDSNRQEGWKQNRKRQETPKIINPELPKEDRPAFS
jgi:hypothetical protein